jgi:integrase/recombinase XerC
MTSEKAKPSRIDVKSFAEVDLAGLLDRFLKGLKSEKTKEAYKNDLMSFAAYVDPALSTATKLSWNPAAAIDALNVLLFGEGHPKWSSAKATQVVEDYRNKLREEKYASSTINRKLAALRSVFKFARKNELVEGNLDVDAETVTPLVDTRGPGEEKIAKIVEFLEKQTREAPTSKNTRDLAIVRLLSDNGLRRIEVSRLNLGDLDFEDRTMPEADKKLPRIWVWGKGKSEAESKVTLTKEGKEALEQWLKQRDKLDSEIDLTSPDSPVFLPLRGVGAKDTRLDEGSIYRLVAGLGKSLGLGRVWPHGFRHTGITEVLEATGGDIFAAAAYSRHKNIQMLQRYNDNIKDAGASSVEKLAERRRNRKKNDPRSS